jgi:hypothetical protein
VVCPSEAARLQTFPDDYFFEGVSEKQSRTVARILNNMITDKEFKDFHALKKEYSKIVEAKTLDHYNKIIQIGAFTAELDKDGEVVLSQTKFPSQFTEVIARKIFNMNWVSNSDRNPTLEILNVRDWYTNRINALDTILSFNK